MVDMMITYAEIVASKGHLSVKDSCTKFCKLASIERFGDVSYKTKGVIFDEDIHGNKWNDRVILAVTAYDRTGGKVAVINPNGLEWIMDVAKITFCNKNGSPAN